MLILNVVLGLLLVLVFFAAVVVIVREQRAMVQGTRKPRWWLVFLAFVALAIDLPLYVFTSAHNVSTVIFGVLITLFSVVFLVVAVRRMSAPARWANIAVLAGAVVFGVAVTGYGISAATAHPCTGHCYSGLSGSTVRGRQP